MFIAPLAITKRWKRPKYPSTDEWMNQMWSICTMEQYSVTKRNEALIPVTTWMNLENIKLSERSQARKHR